MKQTHTQAMKTFCALFAAYGLDAAVAGIASTRKPPARACSPWVRAACEHYHLTPQQLLRGGRVRFLADARAVTMWLIRRVGASYPDVGKALGGLHHTTCIVGVRKVEKKPQLMAEALEILARVERDVSGGGRARPERGAACEAVAEGRGAKAMSVIIVGESNPCGQRPELALYHLPRNASGNRLREHLGLTDVEYHKIDKVNLCTGKWSMTAARASARCLLREQHTVLVLLGAKVRATFDGPSPFYRAQDMDTGIWLVGLPHPSVLNRQWHALDARKRAVEVLTSVAPEIPWRVRT